MTQELHKAQATILRELLFNKTTTFAQLNKTDLTNDHFTFHIKQLSKDGYIKKDGTKYFLTQKGKLYANKLDVDSLEMEKFGTPSVAVTAIKKIHGVDHYLIHHRLKEPFYGYWGFVNGKVRFGEFSKATAKRELKEETGLLGNPEIMSVTHKIRGPKRSEIKLDHFFFLYLVRNPKGKIKNTKEGKNYWKTLNEIKKLKTFPGFEFYLKVIESGSYKPYREMYIKVNEI